MHYNLETEISSALPSYVIKGLNFAVVNNYKYLEVHVSDTITWDIHI